MSKTLNVQIKNRVDTSANWTSNNPILLSGEIGIENDTGKIKVGDGTSNWNSLSYEIGTKVPENAKFTDTIYTLPTATSSVLGGIKTGLNITNSSGTISITKSNVTSALGYTPPTTDTTYSDMVGATSSSSGIHGLVPAPIAGTSTRYLRSDGTWQTPPDTNTTYNDATTS